MIRDFSEWLMFKEQNDNNQNAVDIIVEALARVRPDISGQDWELSQKEERRSARPGDVIITSASNFLSRKTNTYNLRVGDFNFMIVSPDGQIGDAVTAVGSRKTGKGHKNISTQFDRSKLYDVTRAFIDDPFRQKDQRIFVFVKNESPNIIKMLERRTKEMTQNVSMSHRADEEDRKNQAAHFNAMKSLGVDPDKMAHIWRKQQNNKLGNAQRISDLSTGNIPQAPEPVDDLDARIQRLKEKRPIAKPIDDEEWNKRLASVKFNQ